MSYEYLNASLASRNVSPTLMDLKDDYVDYFQEVLNQEFENASDLWKIQEESPFASGTLQDVYVRLLAHVINNDSGNKIGDDYKKILFKDIGHSTGLGVLYYFNDNWWITTQTDRTKQLAASSVIKRCNNTLRWIDLQGAYHSIPCSIDYLINENRDYSTAGTSLVMPAAQLEIICQWNDETNLIRPNQRFLFGNANNWNAYKTLGGGINNFNNLKTEDNLSNGFMRLSVGVNYVNLDTDDIVNGIADAIQIDYALNIVDSSITGNVSSTRQLVADVTMDGISVTRSVTWVSSNISVATVNATGLVTFVGLGSATITCSLLGNDSVSDTCSVSVVSGVVSNYQVVITPDTNFILQGETQIYNCKLYLNGSLQSDVFTFTLGATTIPSTSYLFTVIDGNNFSVKNIKKDLSDTLTITCTSGANSRVIDILLKGVY